MLKIASTRSCDVLIIGAGGAGLRCAARILEKRPRTGVVAVTKVGHAQKSHTSTAQGGLAAVDPADAADQPIFHMFDTWKGSDCTADQNVVRKICEAAWDEITWLENRGMHFSRDPDGRLSKRTFGGHTVNFGEASAYRAVFESDRTGKGIMDTAWGEALKQNTRFINQSIAVELLFKGKSCVGAIIFLIHTGEFIRIFAKATVLATGGSGQVFQITTNCRQNTGDGLALALLSGLPIMDPEAVQFHPTGIVGPGILASETLRSVGGILRNKDLEPFMEKYAPKMKELAPRDLVARAMESEIREGKGAYSQDHAVEHVWIDLKHLPEAVHKTQIPEVTRFFKRYVNIDPQKELCPVRPSCHYHMGGIPTDEFGQVQDTDNNVVNGLFAVGECAAASFHGFNRLGTNSILELITMGKFAANRILALLDGSCPDTADPGTASAVERFEGYLKTTGTQNSGAIKSSLRRVMTEQLSVFRTETGILQALQALDRFREQTAKIAIRDKALAMNPELLMRWELDNLVDLAEIIARAALQRKESRGAHYRDDFPQRRDAFNHHTLVSMNPSGDLQFGKRDVDMSIFDERQENYEKFGLIQRKY
jgi:succinate dehydrogenase / fumarate reductase flavoprotein subunit